MISPQQLWIETDLEPDDVLALKIFPKANYYVVSEGNAYIKYIRLKKYLQLLNYSNTIIIKGDNHSKSFKLDGKEFDILEDDFHPNTNYLDNFIKFASSSNPIMISIKPIRELINEFKKNKDLIKSLTSNITMYCYGGFNLRCIKEKDILLELINSFKEVYIYESFFATGQTNSINKDNFSELYQYLSKSQDEFDKTLMRLIYNWNLEMVESIKDSSLDRHIKILKNIEGHMDFQIVLADFALAAVYRDISAQPITNLQLGEYTQFDLTTNPTNIYAYIDIDINKIKELIMKYI